METGRVLLAVIALIPVGLILTYIAGRAGRGIGHEALWEAFLGGAAISFAIIGAGAVLSPLWQALGLFGDAAARHGSLVLYGEMLLRAALPEETGKLLFIWLFALRHPSVRGGADIILAAVAVSLGFAAVENLSYVFGAGDRGRDVALLRAATAVPAHACFGMIMGAFLAAMVRPGLAARQRALCLILAWAGPVVLHTIYNGSALEALLPWTLGQETVGTALQLRWHIVLGIVGLTGVLALAYGMRGSPAATDIRSRETAWLWILLGGGYVLLGGMVSDVMEDVAVDRLDPGRVDAGGRDTLAMNALSGRVTLYGLSAMILPLIIGGSMVLYGTGLLRRGQSRSGPGA